MNLGKQQQIVDRFRVTLDLFELALDMLEQTLRRKHPDATNEEIDDGIRAWLGNRPGAEYGDGEGRPVSWPRSQ